MALTFWDYIIFFVTLVSAVLIYFKWNVGFYQRRGVKTLKAYPVFGNILDSMTKKKNFMESINDAYKAFPNEKYVGYYQFQKPFLIIKDLEIIKQVTVKDFDHFQDHSVFVDEDVDPLFGKNLLALKGHKWRDMRATLSPAFTSSKMKNMFQYVADCGELMTNYYSKKMQESPNQEIMEIDLKDTFTRYTNDVIATSAFGVKVDSLAEPENQFYIMGKEATQFSFIQMIKSFGFTSMPRLMKLLKISLFGPRITNFFRNLVLDQMYKREKNNIIRPDMIHLLMEAKKGSLNHDNKNETSDTGFSTVQESTIGKQNIKREWNNDDIIAQALLFFFAGFDTSSTLLSFLSLEVAINSEVQEKLREEVDEVMSTSNGKPTYTDIQNMKYLDMVVSETLRKWPPGGITDRQCIKPYKIPPSNTGGKHYQINANEGIWIPIYSIHRDPKYYQDPDEFNPERFSDENKGNIQPFTYIPFGVGPRNCIGSRFALMEIKSVMCYLISKFEFVQTPKTPKKLELSKKEFRLIPEGGFWVGMKIRK